MTETATPATYEGVDFDGQAEGLDSTDASEILSLSPLVLPKDAAARRRRIVPVPEGLQHQLVFVMHMRGLGQQYLTAHPAVEPQELIWRLVAAVSIAVGVATAGLVLTVIALTGKQFAPNPYVALALLLVGCTLCATVATVLNGGLPKLRRR